MKAMVAATDTAYGTLNVKVSGYDMTVVEHYSQYIHRLCKRLDISVSERWVSACPLTTRGSVTGSTSWRHRKSVCFISSYALPTKTTEVMLMPETGTKMYTDSVLKTHQRVVQVKPRSDPVCSWFSFRSKQTLPITYWVLFFPEQLSSLEATLCPIFLDLLLQNQPEGLQLSVTEVGVLRHQVADKCIADSDCNRPFFFFPLSAHGSRLPGPIQVTSRAGGADCSDEPVDILTFTHQVHVKRCDRGVWLLLIFHEALKRQLFISHCLPPSK